MNILKSVGFWMLVIAVMILFAQMARAQSAEPAFLACPPEFDQCFAHFKAPASPSVDKVCLRKIGVVALDPALCKLAGPSEEGSIQFPKPALGTDHVRYELVACDDQLGLCSVAAEKRAIAVDLGVPSFFEVLRRAFGQ